ncbi:unnamed protein product [Sphagnum compactum]
MEMEAASQSSSSQITAQHAPPSLGVAIVGRELPDAAAAASTPPPPPVADAWQRAWRALIPQWNQVRGSLKRLPDVPILRVNQIDAARLDVEMTAMLREQLNKVFSLAQPGLLLRYELELNALLEFLVWQFSVWVDRPTPGNALMNLRYRDERAFASLLAAGNVRTGLEGPGLTKSQKLWYCLAMVGGRYSWGRLQLISAFHRWGDQERSSWACRAWRLLQRAESVFKIACFVNLLFFLRSGRYPSIVERLLRARLVYQRPQMDRAVSFEYMNRQLVWHEFSELLLLVLPLLNMMSIRSILMFPFSNDQSSVASLPEGTCPVCEAYPITTPFMAIPCGHLYCYFCLRTRTLADANFRCRRCSTNVVALKRFQEQVSLENSQKGESL